MEPEFRKVKSLPMILLAMLFHGWWKIDGFKRADGSFKPTDIKNCFGKGYWSLGKFAMCGKILKGFWIDGLFHTEVWQFQPMFVSKKRYAPKSWKRENGIQIFSMKSVKVEG
jgi:hypothetical protein